MRRLTPPAGLPASAFEALDRRLDPHADRPVAVAFSGGGDSLAALLLTKAWADRAGRPVAAITVDHGLQAASAGWTETCADLAHALGVAFQPVVWTGEKPAGGLPAAARQARHDLLARTARAIGARVVVLGHTADDRLEAELMRADGSTLGELRAWSPSPVWPEGRGLFLLRPLLGLRRAALRDLLAGAGLAWIDDPANADPRFARSRARARLGPAAPDPPPAPDPDPQAAALAARCRAGADGGLSIDRSLLRRASLEAAVRFVAAAATCAAGRAGPPRRA
ncbi:tRNA lysidine(34) synthetase TilS, partial [Caulobacter sp. CCUG 60055]|nr:tRNA lysidine(34) synthetase TilS [Caulobacter sp. CCUG 60055]